MDVGKLHAVLVAEPAAHIDGGRVRPFRRADALALQVGGAFDAGVFVHVERGEPEQARADHRQADDVGILARHLRHEFGEGEFRHVPFAVEGEAGEDLVMPEHRPGVVDAFGLHGAEAEVAEMVVVGGGNRQLDLVHFVRFLAPSLVRHRRARRGDPSLSRSCSGYAGRRSRVNDSMLLFAFASWIACQIFSDVTGMVMSRTP